jgi:hypothetical protein
MPRILVNNVELPEEIARPRWGDTLDRLDRRCAVNGQVLTAVRFDGVERPSFRDRARAFDALDDVQVIDVEAASPQELLSATVDEAMTAAQTLALAAARVGAAFRGIDIRGASRELMELARSLGTLVAIAQALSQASAIGLDAVDGPVESGAAMVDRLTRHADTLIAAQQREDWVAVADVVEYDLAPALRDWPALFEALHATIPATPAA